MNAAVAREFADSPATRAGHVVPLIIGITGAQSSGKTWSALRLATGLQRAFGGDIYGIDTEAERMLHYADYFNFRHVPFVAPFGPLDYMAAIEHCLKRGASVIVVDSMSHEHTGPGGILDQIDTFIEEKLAKPQNANKSRENFLMAAQIKCKRERDQLNQRIVQIGKAAAVILCYRAKEKIKPVRGKEPEDLGWQATTTSDLPYDMTVRFLLPPGSNGIPLLEPTVPGERLLVKNPEQFREWFREGDQLSESMGEALGRWAKGADGSDPVANLIAEYIRCTDEQTFSNLEGRRAELWKKSHPRKPQLKEASDAAARRLKEASSRTDPTDQGGGKAEKVPEGDGRPTSPSGSVTDNATWIATLNSQTSSKALNEEYSKCTDAYGGLIPLEVSDAYEYTRDVLVEREATRTDDY